MRTRVIRLLAGAAVVAIAASAPGQAAAPLPRLLTEDGGTIFAIKPGQIIVSGDGAALIAGNAAWIGRNPTPNRAGSQFGHVEWLAWKAKSADGIATFWLDNCKPNCATGTYFPTGGLIAASRVRNGRFTRLELATDSKKVYRYSLQRAGTAYVWNLSPS